MSLPSMPFSDSSHVCYQKLPNWKALDPTKWGQTNGENSAKILALHLRPSDFKKRNRLISYRSKLALLYPGSRLQDSRITNQQTGRKTHTLRTGSQQDHSILAFGFHRGAARRFCGTTQISVALVSLCQNLVTGFGLCGINDPRLKLRGTAPFLITSCGPKHGHPRPVCHVCWGSLSNPFESACFDFERPFSFPRFLRTKRTSRKHDPPATNGRTYLSARGNRLDG